MADLATSRAEKTQQFQGGMARTILDLTVRRDTYDDEIENDKNQIFQLELEINVLAQMSERLGNRVQRRQLCQKEFEVTYKEALMASKKLKAATSSLAGICNKV
jgi:hypothetical protein